MGSRGTSWANEPGEQRGRAPLCTRPCEERAPVSSAAGWERDAARPSELDLSSAFRTPRAAKGVPAVFRSRRDSAPRPLRTGQRRKVGPEQPLDDREALFVLAVGDEDRRPRLLGRCARYHHA